MPLVDMALSKRNSKPITIGDAEFRWAVVNRSQAETAIIAVKQGESLSNAVRNLAFLPPVALQLIRVGEESARLAQMSERAAVLVETWLARDRKRIASILDPVLMMLVGVFVLIVVLAILLPIFELQSVVIN